MHRRNLLISTSILVVLLACNFPSVIPISTPTVVVTTAPSPTPTRTLQAPEAPENPTASPTEPSSVPTLVTPPASPESTNQPLLEWEGFGPWGDGDETRCKALQVESDLQVQAGSCEDPASAGQPAGQQFTEMALRFAPFEYVTANERVVFRGEGEIAGPAWQRAILAWAHWTFAEVTTGHACAACRTVLSWEFGPVPDQLEFCTHLVVLDYGYAYVETSLCGGGDVAGYTAGWLETDEWGALDAWLTDRGALLEEDRTFAGKGTNPLTAEELEQLEGWTSAVFTRLSETGDVGSGQGG